MKIEIKNKFSDDVIFSHEQEDNSIKVTIELAIKSRADLFGANLSGANLSRADLSDADLSGADLYGADLSRTNLSGADLSRTNMSGANLSRTNLYGADLSHANLSHANLYRANLYRADLYRANLSRADLSCANLSGANLSGANLLCQGDMRFVFTMQLDTWMIGFTKDTLQIGCQKHSIAEWREFTDERISNMSNHALVWWKRWKVLLFSIIDERLKDL